MTPSSASIHTTSSSGSQSTRSTKSTRLTTIKPPQNRTISSSSTTTRTSTASHAATPARPPTPVNPPPTPTNGIRAQLHHLLPKHAFFQVQLQIHQLSSVPLVTGEFGVRWKFKNVHTPKRRQSGNGNGAGGLFRRKRRGTIMGKEREVGEDGEEDGDETGDEDSNDSPKSGELPLPDNGVPSVVVSGQHTQITLTTSRNIPGTVSTPNLMSNSLLSPSWSTAPPSTNGSPAPSYSSSPSKGMTSFVKLREHSVEWEQPVSVVVRMDVERDTLDLLPNELKLVIMQRVIQGDPDAPHNPRLGAVSLNLAEYVGAGSVTRRYLLRDSKTNATLKLTISLTHIGGESQYIAPPLPKGEILNGISGLLDSEVYKTRPKAVDLFGSDIDATALGIGAEAVGTGGMGLPFFDPAKLPLAYGPKTTESLIEALFNPVPTYDKKDSPFTYYVPPPPPLPHSRSAPAPEEMPHRNSNGTTSHLHEGEVESVYSLESSAGSEDTYASAQTTSSTSSWRGKGKDTWWARRKMAHHGLTPNTVSATGA